MHRFYLNINIYIKLLIMTFATLMRGTLIQQMKQYYLSWQQKYLQKMFYGVI